MEILIPLAAIFLIFGFVPYQGFKFAREKAKYKGSSGDALRRSELEEMIREAAEEAVGPLRERIETLEAIATDPDEKLEGRVDPSLLLDDSEENQVEAHEADPHRTRT